MPTMSEYMDRLRALVPGRTLGLYLLANTLLLGIVDKAEDVSHNYAALVMIFSAICLVLNLVGGLAIDKRPFVPVLLSCVALLLFMASQRFVGPLAALGIDTKPAFVVVGFLTAAFIALIPAFYRGPLVTT